MYELLTSNIKTNDARKIRQLVLLNLLALISGLTSMFFAFFNLTVTQLPNIATLNIVGFLISWYVFLDLRYSKNLQRVCRVAIISVVLFFTLFVYFNKNDGYGLFWVSFVPLFVIGLTGFKRSIVYIAPYFMFVFALAYSGIGEWNEGDWSTIGFIRLFISTLIFTAIAAMMDVALSHSYRNLEHTSSVDELTNIFNRRKIQEFLSFEFERTKRYNTNLALILFDIDNFKKINDTFGHNSGDRVLHKLAQTIQKSLRKSDYFGRWGGEEFIIVSPNSTEEEIHLLSEKIRETVTQMSCSIVDNLSCSFGATIYKGESDTTETLIERVDKAMYMAKELGKNRVQVL